ncbi:MAG: hypothetical protein A2Z88_01920 [Omnitrophica WOR_2 bacterium GWA2_47_8]|nr:MAG: hypothetical protein A2Z88_01920 [Omnitrophica WOR_2 bacterium GWA2_47_8]
MININDAKRKRHSEEGIGYIPVFNNGIFSISHVFLGPKESVPLHKHQKTHHIYFAEKGDITLVIDGKQSILREKSYIEIQPGKAHKVTNNGIGEAQFITFEMPPDDEDIEMIEEQK